MIPLHFLFFFHTVAEDDELHVEGEGTIVDGGGSGGALYAGGGDPGAKKLKPSYADRLRSLSGRSAAKFKMPCGMTNFHLSLCIGIFGFFVFWVALLLRIYLPEDYWL